jgi:predicted aspartyl protease/tetratricopeptide (TPR) repeat protein
MRFLITHARFRRLAVRVGTAFLACLVLMALASSAFAKGDKTRNKAERSLRTGDYENAEKIYRQLLSKDPNDLDSRLGLSRALLKQRHLQDAFDQAARVIAVDPLSARAHALLGATVLAAGNFRQSVEEFRTALSLKDDEALAVAGLAMVDFYENRLSSCVAGLRRAASLDPGEPDYVFSLGQAAARFQRYREAADAYERFLDIAPRTDADRRARIRGLIDFLRYLGQQGSLYFEAGADRTSISFDSNDNRPILKVRVNGSKDVLRFVLDTGSGMSVLSVATAKKLGIHPIARGGLARGVGGGGRFEIVYGYLSSVGIGDVRIENVPVYIRHFYDENNPVDGYIGISVLGDFLTTVDYGTRTLALVRQRGGEPVSLSSPLGAENEAGRPTSPVGIDLPMRTTSSGFISSEVYLEGVKNPLNFIVDTGASVTVVSEKVAALDEVQSFLQRDRMKVFGAAGVTENVKIMHLPRLTIGGYERESVVAAVLDLDPINETTGFLQSGILGGNFLRQFRVTFDFHHNIVRLEPLGAPGVQNESAATSGAALKRP